MHDETLKYINRGHDLQNFISCVKKLKKHNINVVVHLINGLPNETPQMMLENIHLLNSLKIDGIKIHNLYVVKNTRLADFYYNGNFELMSKEEYIAIVCEQIKLLDPNIVIHRLTGDPKKEDLIAPLWAIKKIDILNGIVKKLKSEKSHQGDNFKNA